MTRRGYLDWLRGVAVLIMIEAHTLDSWTRVEDRSHPWYGYLMVLAGFGAPLFLFLAGVALALAAGSRLRKGQSDAGVAAAARKRGWQIFGLAFLFRLQSWLISGGPFSSLLKVDILNVMGLSMLTGAVLWGWGRTRWQRAGWFIGVAVACAMVTPIVRETALFSPLPDRLEAYFRPVQGRTTFSLFPWAGFLLFGAAIGAWLDTARSAHEERRINFAFAAIGIALALSGHAASFLPTIYENAQFWTSSPTFFFLRTGILIAVVPLAYAWSLAWKGYSPLEDLGRASLFIYWIHVEMVYGVISAGIHRQLSFPAALGAFGAFVCLMFALVKLKDRFSSRPAHRGRVPQPAT